MADIHMYTHTMQSVHCPVSRLSPGTLPYCLHWVLPQHVPTVIFLPDSLATLLLLCGVPHVAPTPVSVLTSAS